MALLLAGGGGASSYPPSHNEDALSTPQLGEIVLPTIVSLSAMVKISAVLYAVALGIVLFWAGWSVKKHGWVRRSLRRFSYLIFVALLTSRLSWCVWVLVQLHAQPADCLEENCGVIALRSATAVALSHTAFCLWFLVFSMLVCGWADSTYMMMSGRSLQPTQVWGGSGATHPHKHTPRML